MVSTNPIVQQTGQPRIATNASKPANNEDDRVKMLLPDSKVEQGKRHSTADHMTGQGLCSEQARWTLSRELFISFLLAAYRLAGTRVEELGRDEYGSCMLRE